MEDRLPKDPLGGGLCSRRQAEVYIQQGRVTVNGRPAALGDKAEPPKRHHCPGWQTGGAARRQDGADALTKAPGGW